MQNKFTFPKEKRIRKSVEYKQLFTTSRRVYGQHCRVHFKVEDGERKMGVVISRKIKGTIIRNRHKRLIREYFRLNQYKFIECIKLVIFVTTCFQPATFEMIDQEITALLIKAEIVK